VIITFIEFGLITDVKDFVIYNLLYGNVNEKLHFGLITSFLSGCLLLVWLLIQMKIELDNYKQLHTNLLNFNSITSHERSFGFFCLLVSVFLLIFVRNVFPQEVGSYPAILIIRLAAIDFMLIAFICRSSKIKNFIRAKLVPNQQIICVIE
jgi:ABC-type methionine transport system permease subunit